MVYFPFPHSESPLPLRWHSPEWIHEIMSRYCSESSKFFYLHSAKKITVQSKSSEKRYGEAGFQK